jgi:hypothetical protein
MHATVQCDASAVVADVTGLPKCMGHDPNRASTECEVSRTVQQMAA